MTKRSAIVQIVLLFATVAFAATESVEQLRAKAAQAEPKDHPKLYAKIADLEVKEVNRLFDSGDVTSAHALLGTLVEDCEKAAKASVSTGKRMKQTEISLRKISDTLEQIRKSVDFDNRPPVQHAIERIEHARNELLATMFTK